VRLHSVVLSIKIYRSYKMSRRKSFSNVQPRTGETHGLFGVKFLKHHNMRDDEWTAQDLISQYEKLSHIIRKSNEITRMQKEQEEISNVELFKKLKKEVKEKRDDLQAQLKGDIQRTKNALQEYSSYQKMYQGKQSYEVLERLEHHDYKVQEKLDRYHGEKLALMKLYEQKLVSYGGQKKEKYSIYIISHFPD
jgi:hypothetical protein